MDSIAPSFNHIFNAGCYEKEVLNDTKTKMITYLFVEKAKYLPSDITNSFSHTPVIWDETSFGIDKTLAKKVVALSNSLPKLKPLQLLTLVDATLGQISWCRFADILPQLIFRRGSDEGSVIQIFEQIKTHNKELGERLIQLLNSRYSNRSSSQNVSRVRYQTLNQKKAQHEKSVQNQLPNQSKKVIPEADKPLLRVKLPFRYKKDRIFSMCLEEIIDTSKFPSLSEDHLKPHLAIPKRCFSSHYITLLSDNERVFIPPRIAEPLRLLARGFPGLYSFHIWELYESSLVKLCDKSFGLRLKTQLGCTNDLNESERGALLQILQDIKKNNKSLALILESDLNNPCTRVEATVMGDTTFIGGPMDPVLCGIEKLFQQSGRPIIYKEKGWDLPILAIELVGSAFANESFHKRFQELPLFIDRYSLILQNAFASKVVSLSTALPTLSPEHVLLILKAAQVRLKEQEVDKLPKHFIFSNEGIESDLVPIFNLIKEYNAAIGGQLHDGFEKSRRKTSEQAASAFAAESPVEKSEPKSPSMPISDDKVGFPLHRAVARGDYSLVLKTLQKSGYPEDDKNEAGETPLQIALRSGNKKLIHLLSDSALFTKP